MQTKTVLSGFTCIGQIEIPPVDEKFLAMENFKKDDVLSYPHPMFLDFLEKHPVVKPRAGYSVSVYEPPKSCSSLQILKAFGRGICEVDLAAFRFLVYEAEKNKDQLSMKKNGNCNICVISGTIVYCLGDDKLSVGITLPPFDSRPIWHHQQLVFVRTKNVIE